jgi:hypothetical protein
MIYILLLLTLTASVCFAQSDTLEIKTPALFGSDTARFTTGDFEVEYEAFSKTRVIKNRDTVFVRTANILSEYGNTLYLSENFVVVSNPENEIALDNLKSITFYKGRNGWTGFGIGAAVGFFSGLASTGFFKDPYGILVYPPLGAILGAVSGGIIGALIRDSESFLFHKMNVREKREELIRLMKKHKR